MNKFEKIAARNIRDAFNFEIGGIYNSYLDGEEIDYTIEEAKDYIYNCAINDLYVPGAVMYDAAPREMRFAGETFCRNFIEGLFAKDVDVAEIPWKEERN